MRVTPPGSAAIDLGKTEANPTIGIVDYSERTTDAFGITTVVKRDFSRRMSVRIGVPTSQIDENARTLANLRATSALWVADSRFAWLSVTGYYEDLSFDLPSGDLSYCKLTVAGLGERETVADPGTDPSANGRPSTLRFIQPTPMTDAVLVSSSVAENDAPAWSASATYAKGARVILASTHRVYESVADGNLGNDPAGATGKWLNTGPTGRWAMLDQALGTSTIASSAIEMVLAPGVATTAVALLDTNAATVRVRAPGYDRTAEPDSAGKVLFLDLAVAATDRLTVTITPAAAPALRRWDDGAQWMDEGVWRDSLAAGDGTVTVGTLLVGAMKALGTTEASPTAGITDYSLKETDDFGEVTVVERAWAKNMGVKALIRTDAVDVVANRIAAARAMPALWIGDTARDSLIVYGFFRDFSIEVGEHTSKLSLSIEGLSKAAPYVPPSTGSVAWPDITDPDGTKPTNNADKTSENTSKDTANVGGRPVPGVLALLDEIKPLPEATELLKRATIDHDALLRQADRDRARLAAASLSNLLDSNVQRVTLRDAGMVTDPETGRIYLYAVDQNAQRVSKVEIGLDAVSGEIALRATYDDVHALITQAQLDPAQAAEFGEVIRRLNSAEVSISGINATIALKADAITVTQLGGIVQDVSLTLDALAGEVATKVSYSDFTPLRDRVGSAEQKLQAIGDVSSYTVTVRQAELRDNAAAAAGLAALVGGSEAVQREIVRSAEASQQLYARLVDGDAAEAGQRLLLASQVGQAVARIGTEETTRASETGSLARSLSALSTELGGVSGSVTRLSETTSAADQARSRDITQVSARIGDFGLISVQQAFSAIVDRTGRLEGRYTLAIDSNGRLQGFVLAGSTSGPATFSFIDTDLRMGTGRIIFDTGSFMSVAGIGFGANGDLLEWFGPSMPIDQCARANAKAYKTIGGDAYFGGSLSAGTYREEGRTTVLTSDARVMIGPFRSNGGARRVVVSIDLLTAQKINGACPVPRPSDPTVTIDLYRGANASGTFLASEQMVGVYNCSPGNGAAEQGDITEELRRSFTFTDTTGGDTASYFARISARTVTAAPTQQTLSLISTEE